MNRICRIFGATLLSIGLLVAQITPSLAAFTDTSGHWGRQSIDRMNAKGVIAGYTDGSFLPERNVTRLEAVTMIVRLMGLESEARSATTIPDSFESPDLVPDWGRGYVAVAVEKGLLKGNDLTTFNGGASARRIDVVVWLARAQGLDAEAQASANEPLAYTDSADIPADLRGYVHVINERKLIQGFPDGTFKPNMAITRAQMATVMARADRLETNSIDVNSVIATVHSVDALTRRIELQTDSGGQVSLPVATTAPIYAADGRSLLLGGIPTGERVEAVRNSLGTVIYLEVVSDDDATPPPAPVTPPPAGTQSGRGHVLQVSLTGSSTVQVLTDTTRLQTFRLSSTTTVRRNGAASDRSAIVVGAPINYTATDGTLTSIDIGTGTVGMYDGRVVRVDDSTQHRLIIFDYYDSRGERQSRFLNVATTVPITREDAAASLSSIKTGDRVIIRYDRDQAQAIAAYQWSKDYEGNLEALLFSPNPRLQVRTATGLVELTLPEDPDDVTYRRQDPTDSDTYHRIGLLDLLPGDQVEVRSEGGEVVRVTVLRSTASVTGTIRSVNIGETVELTLLPDGSDSERTYRVAPNVRVEAGDKTVSLLEARAGSRAELYLSGDVIHRILLQAADALAEEFRGRIAYISGEIAVIEPSSAPDTYRQVELASGGVVVRGGKVSSRISALEVGDVVVVVGQERGGRFQAVSVTVVGSQ